MQSPDPTFFLLSSGGQLLCECVRLIQLAEDLLLRLGKELVRDALVLHAALRQPREKMWQMCSSRVMRAIEIVRSEQSLSGPRT